MAEQQIRIEIVPFPDGEPDVTGPEVSVIDLTDRAVDASLPPSGLHPVRADELEIEPAPEPPELAEDEPAPQPEAVAEPDGPTAPPPESAAEAEPDAQPEPEPEPEPAAVVEAEPAAVVEPEPEPAVVPEPEPEPALEADAELDAVPEVPTEPVEPLEPVEAAEPAEAAEPVEAVEPVATPVSVSGPRREPRVLPVSAPNRTSSVTVEVDDSRLRSSSLMSRLLLFTLAALVVAAAVMIAAVLGVANTNDASRQVAAVGDARVADGEATAELRALGRVAPAEVADAAQRLEQLTGEATAAARPWAPDRVVDAADAATRAYAEARLAAPDPSAASSEYRAALAARGRLAAALEDRGRQAVDRSESTRSSAIAAILVIFLLGAAVLVLLGRLIGRSVALPLRSLGRRLRRFGEGDMRARAVVAPDEVGTLARSFNAMADEMTARVGELSAKAERDAQLRAVSDALDLADRESDVYRILEQAFAILTPDHPAELLVNEPTSTVLWQVSANPSAGAAECPVQSADGCPAMRRTQTLTFDGPAAINACPHLREHPSPCSAVCVPVGVNGQLLGVVHVTGDPDEPPDADVVEQLVALAGQVGVRVGAMRTLETTRLEASTDGLTGLANRRMLEARMGEFLRGGVSFALAVADLDNFKYLNDTYGHETGDRALQLFAKVLEDNVRGHDVVARYGGEEFVLVYPELSVNRAMEVIERIRSAMERAVEGQGLPHFTCSFGVSHSSVAPTPDAIIRIADAGLLMAKELGRNRVVFADEELAAEVFGGGGGGRSSVADGVLETGDA